MKIDPALWLTDEKDIPSRPVNPEKISIYKKDHWYDYEFIGWGDKKVNQPKSPGNGSQNKKIISLIPNNIYPYSIPYERSMKKSASFYGMELLIKHFNWGDEKDSFLDSVISSCPDLIIIIPDNSKKSIEWVKKINESGIPVIGSNLSPDREAYKYLLTWTGPDDWLQNRLLARKFAELMNFSGGYALINHLSDCSAFYSRKWGVITELNEYAPEMELLVCDGSELNNDKTYNLVVSWIESYGERLKGIYCPDNIMSVSKAVKDLGREDIICVAPGSTESGVLMLKEDYLDAITFQSSELDGELPVKVAAEWFDGLRISPIYYLPVYVLTKNNVDDFKFNIKDPKEIDLTILLKMIQECNSIGVEMFFSSLPNKFASMGVLSIDYFRGFFIELLSSLISLIKQNNLPESKIIGDYELLFKKLFNQQSVERSLEWIKFVSHKIIAEIMEHRVNLSLVSKIKGYVDENYNKPISLKLIAAEFECSSGYIGRVFKDEYGSSFSDYLNHLRIEEAKKLLIQSGESAANIGMIVGYSEPNYFYRIFKKVTGVSPSEFSQNI